MTIDGVQEVFIPNVFSPNGDGVNDFFTVFGTDGLSILGSIQELTILDRTGNQVFRKTSFEADAPALGWDGKVENQPAASGVYCYAVTVSFLNGEERSFRGDLLLVR